MLAMGNYDVYHHTNNFAFLLLLLLQSACVNYAKRAQEPLISWPHLMLLPLLLMI